MFKSESSLLAEAIQHRQLRPAVFDYSATGPPHMATHQCVGTVYGMFGASFVQVATGRTKRASKDAVSRKLRELLPPCLNYHAMPMAVLAIPVRHTPCSKPAIHVVAIDAEWSPDGVLLSIQTATMRSRNYIDVTVIQNATDAALHIAGLGTNQMFVFLDGRQDRKRLREQWNITFPVCTDVEDHLGAYCLSAHPGLPFLARVLLGVNVDKGPRMTFGVHKDGLSPTQFQYAALDAVLTLLVYMAARLSRFVDDVSQLRSRTRSSQFLAKRFINAL
jgi:hypothetical protein